MSLLLLLCAVLVSLLVWVAIKLIARNQYWAQRGVPHSPPNPLLGSFSYPFKQNVGIFMRDVHVRFSAPLVGIWVFWKPVLLVGDPQIARRVLIQDSDLFRNRHAASGKTDTIGSKTLFAINDPTWTAVRRRLTYIFTGAKLKALQGFTTGKAKDLVRRIQHDNSENRPIEVRDLCADLTTDVFGTFAFGIKSDAVLTGNSALRVLTRTLQKFSVQRGLSWLSIFFWPDLVDIFGFKFFPEKTSQLFKKMMNNIIEYRINNDIQKSDLVNALINMKKEGLDGEELDDDLLLAQANIMLLGGFDTTAGALTFTIIELANNPDIQDKLYKELAAAKEQNKDFDFNVLEKLTYLNCVIKETLRKYPAMGWLDRIAASDYKIDGELTIVRGTPVYVNAIGMHYDPKYFHDPHAYKPERFLPENETNIVPFSYLPFGDGPRICIGMRFAQMTMRTVISELVLNLQIKAKPGYPTPMEMTYDTRGLFLFPGEPMSVEFIPRN